MQITLFDYIIIAVYFLVTLAIGLLLRKRAGQSLDDYFVSGRSLPWWIAGTSMVATTFAADTPLAVTSLVAEHGLAGNWVWWAFAVGGMFTVFVYARLWRRAEVMTDVELVEIRYSGKAAAALRCTRAIYVALIINPIIIGWVTKAMVDVLTETVLYNAAPDSWLGSADWPIIFGLLAVVGVYCTLSGMWGVAMTDVVQFIAAMVGCTLLAYFAVEHVGGIAEMRTKVEAQFPEGGQAFRFLPNVSSENPWMPLHIFLIYLGVQWWATWYPGAEPGGGGYVVQRMAACRDEGHALKATLWYQIAHYCIRPWPWLLVAFSALALYPELRQLATDEAYRAQTGQNAGNGFAWIIRDVSPAGLRGLMLVTFFAAFMSTISTQMNWGASYLMRDVYQRFISPNASDKELTTMSRWVSLLVLFIGGIVSLWMVKSGIEIDDAWQFLLALGAGTGAVFMLRWFWWRINAWSEISAMAGSLVFFGLLKGRFENSEETMVVVAFATMATWLLVTFITPADSMDTLTAFYRKVRPGGPGWAPVARRASDVVADKNLGASVLTSIVAAGIVYLTLPAVGCLIFGEFGKAAALIGGAIACTALVAILMRRIGAANLVR